MNDRYSKSAFLHRVKERKTASLSAQARFAPFSLKVAWSGKSLIAPLCIDWRVSPLYTVGSGSCWSIYDTCHDC